MTTTAAQASSRTMTWAWAAAAMGVFALLLALVVAPEPWRLFGEPRQTVRIGEQAYSLNAGEWQGARSAALRALTRAEAAALSALEAELDERLVELFVLPREQVDLVADWYYSIPGQMARAGSALGLDLGTRLIERLFPPEPWSEQQAMLVAELAASADGHLRQTGDVVLTSFHRELRDRRQDGPAAVAVPELRFDFGSGDFFAQLEQDPALERQALALATGALSTLAARRAAQAAAARSAGRQVGTGLTAACVSTGVAAWLCAGGVFGVTLLSTEVVLMRLDEAQNRDEFEAALLAELDRIEAQFAIALREVYLGALSRSFATRQQIMQDTLRPVDALFGLAQADQPD